MNMNSFVARAVLAVLAASPAGAFAATSTESQTLVSPSVLCQTANADPEAFRGLVDFEANIAAMSATCPEVVLMLLDLPTQTIATGGPGGNALSVGGDTGPDYGAMLGQLTAATAALNAATGAVGSAQTAVSDALSGAQQSGVAVRVALALTSDVMTSAEKTLALKDFTQQQTDALDALRAARAELVAKKEALNAAVGVVLGRLDAAYSTADTNLKAYLTGKSIDPAKLNDYVAVLKQALTDAGTALTNSQGTTTTARTALLARFPDLTLPEGTDLGGAITTYQSGITGKVDAATTKLAAVTGSLSGLLTTATAKSTDKTTAYTKWQAEQKRLSDLLATASTTLKSATDALDAAKAAKTTTATSLVSAVSAAIDACDNKECGNSSLNNLKNKTAAELAETNFNSSNFRKLPESIKTALISAQTAYKNAQAVNLVPLETAVTNAQTAKTNLQTQYDGTNLDTNPFKSAYLLASQQYDAAQKAYDDAVKAKSDLEKELAGLNADSTEFAALSAKLKEAAELLQAKLDEKNDAQSELDTLKGYTDKLDAAQADLDAQDEIAAEETTEESQAVTDAKAALRQAIKNAWIAFDTSKGEAAALEAVETAKEQLDAALAEQKTAQQTGQDILDTVPDPAPTPELAEAAEDLGTAIDNAAAADEEGQALSEQAQGEVDDYNTSNADLEKELAGAEEDLGDVEQSPSSDAPAAAASSDASGDTGSADGDTGSAGGDTGGDTGGESAPAAAEGV